MSEDDFDGVEFYVLDEGKDAGDAKKPAGDLVIQGFEAEDKPEAARKGTAKNGKN